MPERVQVLFAGSLHVDQMIRLPQLPAPGETVIATDTWTQLGGKATNQAVAAAPHVQSLLLACVGNDAQGQEAHTTLTALGVQPTFQVSEHLPTGSSVALIESSGENVGIVLPGANANLQAETFQTLLSTDTVHLLVCQWETAPHTLQHLLQKARAAGTPTLVNAAPWLDTHRGTLSFADHVVVNAPEAQAWTGLDPQARLPRIAFGHPSVVVTLGAGGVLHYQDGELTTDIRAPAVEARSTHGAGDHFVGVLAAHLASGNPLSQALQQAVTSAAQFVQRLHNRPIPALS